MDTSSNKRIAKNTIFLYSRMLVVMAISLYTSRIVLESLGVVDYGIYNVVGGVTLSLIFFSSTLTQSTQRYLNYELGRGDNSRANNVFSLFLELFILIAVVVLLIGLSLGKWFVTTKLSIPIEQIDAATSVLYATILTVCLTLVFSVYEAVVIAQENMKIYAYIGVIDAISKLAIAYLITLLPNKLICYAWMLAIATLLPKLFFAIYCVNKYPESKLKFYWQKSLFKEIFFFNGWNIYGSAIWMINEQGINILLNMFFGPVVNAARGIANQVNNAVNNFSTNFFIAVRPQIIKRYASEEYESLIALIFQSSKFSFFLLWIICLPIMLRTEYVINIWLKNPPEYTVSFVRWTLCFSLISVFHNPVWSTVAAIGRMKKFILLGSNALLFVFPVSYFLLKIGFEPMIVYPTLIIFQLVYQIITLKLIGNYIPLSLDSYLKNVIVPIIRVVPLSILITFFINEYIVQSFIGLILNTVLAILIVTVLEYVLGINKSEKQFINTKIKKFLLR
jgi:hypothetical protein